MRQNNNARRPQRSRNNNGRNNNNNNSGNKRNVNPKVQTFDSNGPSVRVRGNAFQISDKYTSLARDASSSGDHVLAESYLQHAEHYQRFINEYNDRMEKQNAQREQEKPQREQEKPQKKSENKSDEPLEDLDQGFLKDKNTTKSNDEVVGLEVVAEEAPSVEAEVAEEAQKKKPVPRRKPIAKKAKAAE